MRQRRRERGPRGARFRPGTVRLLDKLPRPATRRDLMRRALLVMLLAASAATFVVAQGDKLDYAMLGRIRDEGLNRSQVMDHVSWLSDVYGPRPHRVARHPAGERVGDEEVPRVGTGQRPPGALELRQGLVARPVQRAPRRAADPAAHRLPAGVVVGHQGTGHRRRRPRADRERGRLREISRQAAPARSSSRSRRGACGCSKGRSSCG